MSVRNDLIVFFSGILCLIPSAAWAADVCIPEYQPMAGRYLISAEEAAPLKLSPAERGTVLSTWQEYGEKMLSLHRDFESRREELLGKLSVTPANREEADTLAAAMFAALEESARKGVDWQRALARNVSIGRMSSLAVAHQKGRSRVASFRCGPSASRVNIPLFRYDLNSNEKVLIGLTEEEQANLDQFVKINLRLRDGYRSLVLQLDQELSRREPESGKLETLLGLLALNNRQDMTNALDGYFYAEVNIFTPERMAKLRKHWDKHKRKK
jgi:hypothetical protein